MTNQLSDLKNILFPTPTGSESEEKAILNFLPQKTSYAVQTGFTQMLIVEEEIIRLIRRPDTDDKSALAIWNAFSAIQIHHRVLDDFNDLEIYRLHVRELLQRAAEGGDASLPTHIEMLCGLVGASMQTSLNGPSSALAFTLFLYVFPERAGMTVNTEDEEEITLEEYIKILTPWPSYIDDEINRLRKKMKVTRKFRAPNDKDFLNDINKIRHWSL